MNDTLFFDSLSSPVPEIRRDLQWIPVQDNGQELIYFFDALGYTAPHFALDKRSKPILSLLNGTRSVKQLSETLNGALTPDELLEFVQLLDESRVLNSKHYRLFSDKLEKDFEKDSVRKPALAGDNYPENGTELSYFTQDILNEHKNGPFLNNVKALYAPHIDIRVGNRQYGEAFSRLKNLKPKTVIILATSHYAGYFKGLYEQHPFIGSRKDFLIPGRVIKTNKTLADKLAARADKNGFTLHDRAHRMEHSIELHLLFAASVWQHNFEIVPILVSGFDELFYHPDGNLAQKISAFSTHLKSLAGDAFFLISGDLSHVGKKFGDPVPAEQLRENVEKSDKQFVELAAKGSPGEMLSHLAKDYDATRICGFPPLYTYLSMFPGSGGSLLNYFWWDERETQSAVSFGSILYQ